MPLAKAPIFFEIHDINTSGQKAVHHLVRDTMISFHVSTRLRNMKHFSSEAVFPHMPSNINISLWEKKKAKGWVLKWLNYLQMPHSSFFFWSIHALKAELVIPSYHVLRYLCLKLGVEGGEKKIKEQRRKQNNKNNNSIILEVIHQFAVYRSDISSSLQYLLLAQVRLEMTTLQLS